LVILYSLHEVCVISQISQSNCSDWGAIIDYTKSPGQRNEHAINYFDRKLVEPKSNL